MAYLNNDQRLKKAHKNVRELGNIASTIIVIELTEMINGRIKSQDLVIFLWKQKIQTKILHFL